MRANNNLDALCQDAELPCGHPGRRFDDTPEGFEPKGSALAMTRLRGYSAVGIPPWVFQSARPTAEYPRRE